MRGHAAPPHPGIYRVPPPPRDKDMEKKRSKDWTLGSPCIKMSCHNAICSLFLSLLCSGLIQQFITLIYWPGVIYKVEYLSEIWKDHSKLVWNNKARLGAKPFVWKWSQFACKSKLLFIWKIWAPELTLKNGWTGHKTRTRYQMRTLDWVNNID